MSELLQTPLYVLLSSQKGAKFVPFSGWSMPIQFTGILQEHQAVRESVGLFDISHMGKFILRGKEVITELEKLVPSDLSRLEKGQAQYTVLLNEEAGIIDDLIIYYQTPEEVFLIVNAGTLEKDKQWLLNHLTSTSLEDLSPEKVLLALQGPKSLEYLQPYLEESLGHLKAFGHIKTSIKGETAFIARTGYTGEDGFEIMVSPAIGEYLWQELTAAGVTSCGLGARDTLRLEAAMCLYGQDMDETINPLEAGLGWLVHLDRKGEFIGRSVLEAQKAQGVSRRLVALEMTERNIARHGYSVISQGEKVGEITSGTYSPTLSKPIALAYVPTPLSTVGQSLSVEIRGKLQPAKVVKKPFYRRLTTS